MGSAAVAPYWRELTRRNPTDAVLVEAQFGVGLSMRVTKKHEQEEATFLEVVRVAGPDSPRAQDAMFQVAWSRHFRDDFEGALHAMEEVATSPRRSIPPAPTLPRRAGRRHSLLQRAAWPQAERRSRRPL